MSVTKGIVAVNQITFPTDFAHLNVNAYISNREKIVQIATGIEIFPGVQTQSVIPRIFPKKKSLPLPAHGNAHHPNIDLSE